MNTIEITNIIFYNDYNKLQHLIDNDLLIDSKMIKNYDLLLSKSIEYKSIECFDLLLENINNINNYNISLYKSIDYYINSNNIQNKYYLHKLLEKDIIIDKELLIKAADDLILFKILLVKIINNKYNTLLYLLNKFIKDNKLKIINYLYNYNITNNITTNEDICNHIFKLSIKHNNINTIMFLEKNKYDMIYIIDENNNIIPSLYYSISFIYDEKKIIYKYLLNLYINYSKENDINSINNIDTINLDSNRVYYIINYIIYDLIKLEISLSNYDRIIKSMLSKLFTSDEDTLINNIIETIFILSYNNILNKNSILIISDIIIPNNNYNKRLYLYYILLKYKYILPENVSNYFNKIKINDEKNNINTYINQLILKYYN
jgi:hypothetical protein